MASRLPALISITHPSAIAPSKFVETIIFTTTNGTRALRWAQPAAEIRIAAFANLSAVCAGCERNLAGPSAVRRTDFRLSAEDLLVAARLRTS